MSLDSTIPLLIQFIMLQYPLATVSSRRIYRDCVWWKLAESCLPWVGHTGSSLHLIELLHNPGTWLMSLASLIWSTGLSLLSGGSGLFLSSVSQDQSAPQQAVQLSLSSIPETLEVVNWDLFSGELGTVDQSLDQSAPQQAVQLSLPPTHPTRTQTWWNKHFITVIIFRLS